jgi:hypothetical protein
MIPSANAIVNNLLIREGADDPEHYLNWLQRRAAAGEVNNIIFGAAISTSEDALMANAQEIGVNLLTDAQSRELLERDMALVEANALAILRRMGLDVSDEGHDSRTDRICSCRIHTVTTAVTDIDRLVRTILDASGDEPPRTSSGTLNRLLPEADNMLWANVSNLGQGLIEVTISFFDVDRLREWALANDVLQEAAQIPPEDAPEGYVNRTFDIKEILRGYEHAPGLNSWIKTIRSTTGRDDKEITVRRRGQTTEDNADTLYDIDILISDTNGRDLIHKFTAYSVPLIKLREAVALAEESAMLGDYRALGNRFPISQNQDVQEAAPVPEPPPEDDPESVLQVHQNGLFMPELNRLGFKVGQDKEKVRLFGEEVPHFLVKGYTATDGSQRGVYIFLIHVLSGGNEFRVNNFDAAIKSWFKHDMGSEINIHCQTTAQAAAAARDIDAAMQRSAEMSLPLDQEHEMLQRVAAHYSERYWHALQPPGQPILNFDHTPNQG